MSKGKVYISGPMTGIENNNFKKFFEMEAVLKEMGYEPINPARVPEGLSYDCYIAIDKILVENCPVIMLLKDWEKSNGSLIELEHYMMTHEFPEILVEDKVISKEWKEYFDIPEDAINAHVE